MAIIHPLTTMILFKGIGANFNTTGDNVLIQQFKCASYRIVGAFAGKPSTDLTGAVGGIYTAASKGGAVIVANTQVYSGLTSAALGIDLVVEDTGKRILTGSSLYFSLTTARGVAATGDVYVYGFPLS